MFTFDMPYPQPKPEPQKRKKTRSKRFEAQLKRAVRQIVADRDGYCRCWPTKYYNQTGYNADEGWERTGTCCGESQWAHFGDYRRFKTRGQPAEERHTTFGSLMLCRLHHDAYDGRDSAWTLEITPLTDRGCDGSLKMAMREK